MRISTGRAASNIARKPSFEDAYFFMMNSLLHSRMEAGFPSNDGGYDEDVNVYLASLLTSLIHPRSADDAARRVPLDDASLHEAAQAAGVGEKCALYRRAADSILVSLGIFKNARLKRPDSKPHLALPDAAYIGRGKAYYAIARAYAAQRYRGSSAVGDVLEKLSTGFERYLGVLSLMGGEHLNIFKQLSDGELFHLESAPRAETRDGDLAIDYDRFLDLYSSYLRRKSRRTREALLAAVRKIREIDPSFEFDIDARERVKSL